MCTRHPHLQDPRHHPPLPLGARGLGQKASAATGERWSGGCPPAPFASRASPIRSLRAPRGRAPWRGVGAAGKGGTQGARGSQRVGRGRNQAPGREVRQASSELEPRAEASARAIALGARGTGSSQAKPPGCWRGALAPPRGPGASQTLRPSASISFSHQPASTRAAATSAPPCLEGGPGLRQDPADGWARKQAGRWGEDRPGSLRPPRGFVC